MNKNDFKNETSPDVKLPTTRCFYLLSEIEPTKAGMYNVITSKGRVLLVYFENLLGNRIWEVGIDRHLLDEKVIAWSENIA